MKDNISYNNDSVLPINSQNNLDNKSINVDHRKSARSRPINRTILVQNKVETYSLDELGTIENAKKHRNANRPLHVIKEELNSKVNFCHCCDLPCEEKGIIEPFKVCDNTDIYAECGIGISLYFYFFKFVLLVSLLGILSLSILLMILNIDYSGDIKDVCNEKYKNYTYQNINYIGHCFGFITESSKDENFYNKFNLWLQRLSSDIIFPYRKLPKQLRGALNNKVDDVLVNYSLVNFIFLITTFILNIIFLFLIRAQIKKLKLKNYTIRDYTVLISNAKKILTDYIDEKNKNKVFQEKRQSQIGVENNDDFIRYVNDYLRGDSTDIKIENINICYSLGDYLINMKKFENIKRKIFQINNNPHNIKKNQEKNQIGEERKYYYYLLGIIGLYCISFEGKTMKELLKDKNDYDKKLIQEEERVRCNILEKDFTGYMLITFNKIEDKEKFLSRHPNDFFDNISFFFKNIKYYICPCLIDKNKKINFTRKKDISARDPPEPEDIFWENFRYSFLQRFQKTALTYMICLLIIILSFGIVFGLSLLQDHLYNDDKENGDTNIFLKYLTSLSITIAISIINSIIQLVLEKLTYRERHISKSNYTLSLSIKISIFTFLNSAIVPLISKYIVVIKQKNKPDIDYYVSRKRDELLLDDIFIYFIINAIITPLFWILNFPFWFKKIRICCLERKRDPNNCHNMTQKELNKLYEYPDMNLAYKLSYLAKTLSMCFFYFPIFPLGFIIAFIGFIFAYWAEKYVFTHQCKRPDMLDEIIEKYYANYFIVVLFIGGIGDFIFLHNAFDTNIWNYINIILFGVLIIVPYTKFIKCNYVDAERTYKYNLNDIYFTFYNDYQRQNPLTKKLGLENYLKELKKKNYLSENAYNLAMNNIEKLNVMEMYYGISKNNMALFQQSIIENIKSESIINVNNLRGTFLAGNVLKSTVIKPELEDNEEKKDIKRNYFESQIMNLFGNGNIKNEDNVKIIKEEKNENASMDEDKIMNMPLTVSQHPEDNNSNK